MDSLGPGGFDALMGADMAMLSYEDGLTEIDSFFRSPAKKVSKVPEAADPELSQKIIAQGAERTAVVPLSTANASGDTRSGEQTTPRRTEQRANTDEFATLNADLDHVTATKVIPANPKSQLHFILNAHGPTAKTTNEESHKNSGSSGQRSEQLLAEEETLEDLEEAIALRVDQQTRNQRHVHTDQVLENPVSRGPNGVYATIAQETAASTKARVEGEQALKSPEPLLPPLPRASNAPQQVTEPSQLLQAKLPEEESKSLSTPTQAPHIEGAMANASNLILGSPGMPSSEGKSSLMEEMKEEDDAKHSKLPPFVVKVQSDLAPSSHVSDDGPWIPQNVKPGATDTATSVPEIIKDAEKSQRKAEALVGTLGPKKQLSAATDTTESDGTEAVGDDINGDQEPVKQPKTAPMKRRVAPKLSKTTKKAAGMQQAKPVPQRRKSLRNQAQVQYEEPDSDDVDDQTDKKPSPKLRAIAKRKATPDASTKVKRSKLAARRSTRLSEPAVKGPQQPGSPKPNQQASKDGQRKNSSSNREVGALTDFWSGPRVGQREKTRSKQADEDRKREEEERQKPNAGRAAKDRHKRKTG